MCHEANVAQVRSSARWRAATPHEANLAFGGGSRSRDDDSGELLSTRQTFATRQTYNLAHPLPKG
jgi:hypothetical protein